MGKFKRLVAVLFCCATLIHSQPAKAFWPVFDFIDTVPIFSQISTVVDSLKNLKEQLVQLKENLKALGDQINSIAAFAKEIVDLAEYVAETVAEGVNFVNDTLGTNIDIGNKLVAAAKDIANVTTTVTDTVIGGTNQIIAGMDEGVRNLDQGITKTVENAISGKDKSEEQTQSSEKRTTMPSTRPGTTTTPTDNKPTVTLPTTRPTTPTINKPTVTLPTTRPTTPTINKPTVTLPTVTQPTTPTDNKPTVTLPTVTQPTTPTINEPIVTLPTVTQPTTPTINKPTVTLPTTEKPIVPATPKASSLPKIVPSKNKLLGSLDELDIEEEEEEEEISTEEENLQIEAIKENITMALDESKVLNTQFNDLLDVSINTIQDNSEQNDKTIDMISHTIKIAKNLTEEEKSLFQTEVNSIKEKQQAASVKLINIIEAMKENYNTEYKNKIEDGYKNYEKVAIAYIRGDATKDELNSLGEKLKKDSASIDVTPDSGVMKGVKNEIHMLQENLVNLQQKIKETELKNMNANS